MPGSLLFYILRQAGIKSEEHAAIREHSAVVLKVMLKNGVGANFGVNLGWPDTDGFCMVGVKGGVSLLVADVEAAGLFGLHRSGKAVRAVFGFPGAVGIPASQVTIQIDWRE